MTLLVDSLKEGIPPSLFCSIQAFNGLDEPTHAGEGDFLHYQFKCSSHPETPSDTLRNNA